MSSDVAIQVENLSKSYHIYGQPRDRLLQMFSWGRRQYYREFWALKDVTFNIERGEAVGIIGRNGSGKSTLLQMICGTLNPTKGQVQTSGRVAALLELGAGFNPEFTGRENVCMNAAIMGLQPEEIDACFDDIAAFADIGDFIEQPVKTYSSGMYVRLAFAVIAHVAADILVIDEALAVGDAVFTQKCMRFIRTFREKGTLLFVSHDMHSVLNLCESVVWLDRGLVRRRGTAKQIAGEYLQHTLQEIYGDQTKLESVHHANAGNSETTQHEESASEDNGVPFLDYESCCQVEGNLSQSSGWKGGGGEIQRVQLLLEDGSSPVVLKGGEKVRVEIDAEVLEDMSNPILGFLFRDRLGQDLFGENTLPFTAVHARPASAGASIRAVFGFRLPMLPNGDYAVMASLADGDLFNNVQHHWLHDALIVHVSNSKIRWGLVGVPFEAISLDVYT